MYARMYDILYVYCTYYAPICRANGMEKASFARIVGAERRAADYMDLLFDRAPRRISRSKKVDEVRVQKRNGPSNNSNIRITSDYIYI